MHQLYIYIVEDDLFMAATLKKMLTNLGHCVCGIADTYKKAVYELQRIEVDLVITDIMLTGDKTGIDLGRYMKAHLNVPFIYHSSITENKMIKAAWDTLPDAYLTKPVKKAALANAIINFNNKNNVPGNKVYSLLDSIITKDQKILNTQ